MARVVWDDVALMRSITTIDKRMDAFIYASCRYHATRAQTYARKNAPWADRTSNARNGLFGKAQRNKPVYAMIIGGTVTYQPYLEVRWSGRYAIIRPTMEHEAPELMKTISTGFAVLFGGG